MSQYSTNLWNVDTFCVLHGSFEVKTSLKLLDVLDLTAFLFKTHQYIYYLKVLNMYDI